MKGSRSNVRSSTPIYLGLRNPVTSEQFSLLQEGSDTGTAVLGRFAAATYGVPQLGAAEHAAEREPWGCRPGQRHHIDSYAAGRSDCTNECSRGVLSLCRKPSDGRQEPHDTVAQEPAFGEIYPVLLTSALVELQQYDIMASQVRTWPRSA